MREALGVDVIDFVGVPLRVPLSLGLSDGEGVVVLLLLPVAESVGPPLAVLDPLSVTVATWERLWDCVWLAVSVADALPLTDGEPEAEPVSVALRVPVSERVEKLLGVPDGLGVPEALPDALCDAEVVSLGVALSLGVDDDDDEALPLLVGD